MLCDKYIDTYNVINNLFIWFIPDAECDTKEQVSSTIKEEAGLSNGTPVGISALTSLCSAYASDSDDNEEQTGILIFKYL